MYINWGSDFNNKEYFEKLLYGVINSLEQMILENQWVVQNQNILDILGKNLAFFYLNYEHIF